MRMILDEIAGLLACPVCGSGVEVDNRSVLCHRGHNFDIARQGYVSLLAGNTRFTGDTAEMISARATFLGAGHYAPIADAVAAAVADTRTSAPRILEVGAGSGDYLARVLDAQPDALGLGLDVSKAAARTLARAHPRMASVAADAWQPLPILDGAFTHALCVFAPRNPDEIRRILDGDGAFIVVTPSPRHLAELIVPLDMVRVDEDKTRRLSESMAGRFERESRTPVEFTMELAALDIAAVVGMGPSAHHRSAGALAERISALPDPMRVTASVVVSVYRPRSAITPE